MLDKTAASSDSRSRGPLKPVNLFCFFIAHRNRAFSLELSLLLSRELVPFNSREFASSSRGEISTG